MYAGSSVAVIIPALNEQQAIGRVLDAVPRWVDDVIVVDNGSTDRTAQVAARHGARVVREPRRGYGAACLAGIAALRDPQITVFLDADYSDHPEQMGRLVAPIACGEAALVVGSRVRGRRAAGALSFPQRLGNALACALLRRLWRVHYTDLGPLRAILTEALRGLGMDDAGCGWTVQMQIRAAQRGLRALERPVDYRARIGRSKISGTLRGALRAGSGILGAILKARWLELAGGAASRPARRLIVFTRCPLPGRAKTRLIPALGPAGAAELQRQMTLHTLAQAGELCRRRRTQVEVRFSDAGEAAVRAAFGKRWAYRPQGPGDLGARMERALRTALLAGAPAAVVVGTDCPDLEAGLLSEAFDALERHDAVIGPASDGGYYLIGLRRPLPELFRGIAWGTPDVLAQTLARARQVSAAVRMLRPLADVDEPQDLALWERALRRRRSAGGEPRLSVIVPTLNEQVHLGRTLARLAEGSNLELIVVDGGSSDRTVAIARRAGAVVLTGPRGRGPQMNVGAAAASGELLLFLHADTLPPRGFDRLVRAVLARPDAALGAFAFALDARTPALRIVAGLVRWRCRLLRLPYGDQGLFLRAETFGKLGGYCRQPIMEDFELVRRVRRYGRVVVTPAAARTSARRWLSRGVWRVTLSNQICLAAYLAGVAPQRIARWRRARPAGRGVAGDG